MQDEREKNFFEKAFSARQQISESNSPYKETEIKILSEMVEQVFREGKVPAQFELSSPLKMSADDFYAATETLSQMLELNNFCIVQKILRTVTYTSKKYVYADVNAL